MKKQVSECSNEELNILSNICQIWQIGDNGRIDQLCLNTVDLIVHCSDMYDLIIRVRAAKIHRENFRKSLEKDADSKE